MKLSNVIKILKSQNIDPTYPIFSAAQKSKSIVNDTEMIILGTNDYLGLSQHPLVIQASIDALKKYGTSCCGSRILNGNTDLHVKLEKKLSEIFNKEDTIIYATGMQTNLGAISTLFNDYTIFFDKKNHASLIDGLLMSKGKIVFYNYNDMNDLEKKILKNKSEKMVIISDGVFSMSGEIVNIESLIDISQKYNIEIYLDDAHGVGVIGNNNFGTSFLKDHFNDKIKYNMGVFSKSLGAIGGFISSDIDTIHKLKYDSRSILFSASLPPSLVASILKSIELIETDKSITEKLKENIIFFSKELKNIGLRTFNSKTAIQSVIVGDEFKLGKIVAELKNNGIFTTAVIRPGVKAGEELIRMSVTAMHTKDQLNYVLENLKKMKEKYDF